MPVVKWSEKRVDLADDALQEWAVTFRDGELHCGGPCPRCVEKVSIEISSSGTYVGADGEMPEGLSEDFEAPVLIRCNCEGGHQGRPETRDAGCGAYWVARPSRDEQSATYRLVPERDSVLLDATMTVYAAMEDADAGLRTLADKWIPAVGAVTGALGLAAVVVSKDAVKGLDSSAKLIAYLLVVVATLCAATAITLMYRGAFGWPQEVDLRRKEAVLAAADELDNRAKTVGRQVRKSIGFSVAALTALLAALGVLWLGPSPSDPPIEVTYSEGGDVAKPAQRCGKAEGVTDGNLKLSVEDGARSDVELIPLVQITNLDLNASCEK